MMYFTNSRIYHILFVLILLMAGSVAQAQSVSGLITDEAGSPIQYASVYVKELKQGTTANLNGDYLINVPSGRYRMIFRCLGYETTEQTVEVGSTNVTLNVTLAVKPYQIAPVTIGSKAEDPAYPIIRKAIGYAPFYLNQVKEFNAEVYLKGTLKIKKLSWLVKKTIKNEPDAPKEGDFYLQESVNQIHFTAPDKYDQKVTLFRSNFPDNSDASGSVMQFANASFYQPRAGEIVLPLAPNALRYYNYKYDGFTIQDNRVIYKIKVIPKRNSKQLVSGYLYIADEYYNLHEVDLVLEAFFGPIKIKQSFGEVERDVWLPISHCYIINGEVLGNAGDVTYVSSVKYSLVKLNSALKTPSSLASAFKQRTAQEEAQPAPQPAKSSRKKDRAKRDSLKMESLLQKESLTNREMYQLSKLMDRKASGRDTVKRPLEVVDPVTVTVDSSAREHNPEKWLQLRPVLLTTDEIAADSTISSKLLAKSDSTKVDTTANKSSFIGSLALGHSWYDKEADRLFRFSGLLNPNHFQFNTVDGFVIGASGEFYKGFDSSSFRIQPTVSYSFARQALMGTLESSVTYANKRRGVLGFQIGSTSDDFNGSQGVSKLVNTTASLLFGRNYMKLYSKNYVSVSNRIDIANGLELFSQFEYAKREELLNSTHFTFFKENKDRYTSNVPSNNSVDASNLNSSTAFISEFKLSYTPQYYYSMNKGRKYMLHSKYPTFSVKSRFAIPNVLDSDAEFALLEGSVSQSVKTGPGSSFMYSVRYGGFLSSKNMFFSDFVHFNSHQSPVIMRSFLSSFQNTGYYQLSTNSSYGLLNATYQTPYLALKFLPFLSNRMWQENLHLSVLKLKGADPYTELGYSMSRIAAFASVGVFTGFNGSHFDSVTVKLSFSFLDE